MSKLRYEINLNARDVRIVDSVGDWTGHWLSFKEVERKMWERWPYISPERSELYATARDELIERGLIKDDVEP